MSNCNKSFLEEDMKNIVKKYFRINKNTEIDLDKVVIEYASEGLTGFQAEYYKMKVTASFRGKQTSIFFFIKSLPIDPEKAIKFTEAGYFHKEINIYKTIFPQFDNVQKSTSYIMQCLHSSDTDIVFEDLNKKGYAVTDARNTFEKEHCIVALKSLAKFHAASIILEETKKAETNCKYNIEEVFKDVLTKCGYVYSGWYLVCMKAALEVAGESKIYGKDTKYYPLVQKTWDTVCKDALMLSKSSKSKRNVLCHRDLWANNLMFSYDDDKKPAHCIFVDFQVSLCMLPAADVVSLLCLNLSSSQRQRYFSDLIQCYYIQLNEELKEYHINIEEIIPWHSFKNDCDVYKKWGLMQCLCLHQLGLMEPKYAEQLLQDPDDYERIINVSRNEEILHKVRTDEVYRARYLDSVEDFIRTYIVSDFKEPLDDE